MSSVSTRRGDGGETSEPGGVRVSKGAIRVEASGNIDELNSVIGFARANCGDVEIAASALVIQRDLFKVGSALSTRAGGRKEVPQITQEMVGYLDALVTDLESRPGLIRDWTIPGGHITSAPFEVARTVCRRAERNAVRLHASGEVIQKNLLSYINRLSDVLWLFARALDAKHGIDASLRDEHFPGPPWSRAW